MEESSLNTPSVNPSIAMTFPTKTLFQAAATGDIKTLRWWIEAQHQPLNTKDDYNRTPLMWAALKGQLEVFNYLVSSQSSQQLEAMEAKEALSLAIFQGNWEIVRSLSSLSLEKGLGWQSWVEVSTVIEQTELDVRHTLVKALRDKSEDVRQAAARAVVQLGQENSNIVDTLVKALGDKLENTRQVAAQALGNLKKLSPSAIDALVKALEDQDSSLVRQAAAQALGNLKEPNLVVINALVKTLEDQNDPYGYIRQAAAQALGNLKESSPLVVDALIKALWAQNDPYGYIRQAAAQALVPLGKENESVINALNNAWEDDSDGYIRQAVASALGNQNASSVRQTTVQTLGKLKESIPVDVDAQIKKLRDKSEYARQAAAQALGNVKELSPLVVNALVKALGDKSGEVRQSAAQALGNVKELSPLVVDALVRVLEDKDSVVCQAAAQALGQLSESMTHVWQSLPILKQGLIQVFGDSGDDCPELRDKADKSVFALMVRLLVRHGKKDYLLKHWESCMPYLQSMDGEKGNTGLHEAANYHQREMIELLLGRGIVDKPNQAGESAYDIALKVGAWDAAQTLVGLKAKVVGDQLVEKVYQTDGKLQLLGSGSFGAVYKAHWNDTPVAYKQLHVGKEGLSTEFKSEVNLLSMNPHPNIVTVYAITLSPLGLVMEWMAKGSLRSALDEQLSGKASAFSWSQKITIAQDVAKGLTFLHSPAINLLHRDLKADNILLDNQYHAKLTDFGFAQAKKDIASEKSTEIAGSLPWLAPETLSEQPEQTASSDMYSYGTVLWELTTRKEPYQGQAPEIIKAQILSGKSLELPAETPIAWSQLIQDCWQLEPTQRPLASNVTKYLVKHRHDIDATAEKDNEAAAHFKGVDEENKEQFQPHVGYTAKTLRYLLPMLDNSARCILYVAAPDQNLAELLESLALLSAALGRPAAFLLPSVEDESSVVGGLLFKQRLVWIHPEGKAPSPEQKEVLQTLTQQGTLTHHYISQDVLGISPDQYPDVPFAPASGVLLVEWFRGVLQRPLAKVLQWSEKLPPASGYCSLEGLQSSSLQTLQAQKSAEGVQSHLSLLRQQHLVLLQVQPKEAIARRDDQLTTARTEVDYLKQCWDSAAQTTVNEVIRWSKGRGILTFMEKCKQLRSEDEHMDKGLKTSLSILTKQLEEDTMQKLPLIAASELVLLKPLGAGSFGEVHQALWQQTPVAVKRLQGYGLSPKLLAEFEHESALLASLNHPNVVRLYGICKDYENYPLCMVLEFAAGGGLDSRLGQGLPAWATRQRMALDIARGIDYLHHHNIIHGDLRACNMLLDENSRAKVGDFGLAKQRTGGMSMVMTNERTAGVLYWLSPELLQTDVKTKASDVYSFGMVLWEMMTGTRPFPTRAFPQTPADMSFELTRLAEIFASGELWSSSCHPIPEEAPVWWVTLMRDCCHPDPEKRPTMSVVVERLFAEVEPQVYATYSEKRGITQEHKASVLATKERSRDIMRFNQQLEAPIEQFAWQIKDCLKQNNLSIALQYLDDIYAWLAEGQKLLKATLVTLETSDRSVQLFTNFFSAEGIHKAQGQRITRYLNQTGRDTMACVNRSFNRFFSQLPKPEGVESMSDEEITKPYKAQKQNTTEVSGSGYVSAPILTSEPETTDISQGGGYVPIPTPTNNNW